MKQPPMGRCDLFGPHSSGYKHTWKSPVIAAGVFTTVRDSLQLWLSLVPDGISMGNSFHPHPREYCALITFKQLCLKAMEETLFIAAFLMGCLEEFWKTPQGGEAGKRIIL